MSDNKTNKLVGIVMGSDSDWPTMKAAAEACTELGLAWEANVMSAHRTPDDVAEYARTAHTRGLRVIIAGAGGAAHLAGVAAAMTPLPVIAVPIETKLAGGLDSLLAMVQMPSGVPVATVAVGGARNAGILAAQIIASGDAERTAQMVQFKQRLAEQARAKNQKLRQQL
ncbi:MAG: 5-(carboxyamino)imidazole ribonucleotide mutase [Verrucomicrobia bacterium]|nr:5-(carboxyamino)imidazole ribonucleotide mutase [Verrucomicrobiota bacterium]